jgi:predicted transcriptional regulator
MSQAVVLESVIRIMKRAGWQHSQLPSSCFDVLGKGADQAALVKVHKNIDSVTRQDSAEMKQAARYLSAAPLIVGERNSRGDLEKQVIYERYGIPTINTETLEAYLDLQEQLYVMNRKGGYYVSIDEGKLEERRKSEGYSVNSLAKEVGVTSRTVTKYRKNGVATVETAQRLTEVLGDVVEEVDILAQHAAQEEPETDQSQHTDMAQDQLTQRFIRIGLEAARFTRAPFDVAAKDDEDRFVAQQTRQDDEPRVDLLRAIRDLSNSTPFLITKQRASYSGIEAISEQRLQEIRDKDEFKDALR